MIIAIIVLLLAAILISVFLWWQDNTLQMDEYEVESPILPQTLNGCKILHLSDLHNKSFGPDQKRLIAEIEKIEPDLILISGDMIDKRRTKEDSWGNVLSLVRQAAEYAPVFFVSGNHEWESGLYPKLRRQMETLGVEVLDNGFVVLDHGDAALSVMGIADPAAFSQNVKQGKKMEKEEMPDCITKVQERLEWLCEQQEENAFQVLIAHRPLNIYSESGVHLIFCGHAHGGQVRIPGIGGLYAPDQGFLPKFTEGPYISGNTVMIVNRGLGNSGFPFRVFNRPQMITVILRAPGGEELEESEEITAEENGTEDTITEETAVSSQEEETVVPDTEGTSEEDSITEESAEAPEDEVPPFDQIPEDMVPVADLSQEEENQEIIQEPIPEPEEDESQTEEILEEPQEPEVPNSEEDEAGEPLEEAEPEIEQTLEQIEEPLEESENSALSTPRSVTPEEKEAFERMLEDAFPDEDKKSLMESVMSLGDDMDEEAFQQMMESAFSEMRAEIQEGLSSEEEPQILNP